MVDNKSNVPIDLSILHCYFKQLVNKFFKILPMREENEESLVVYMQSLKVELLGCQELIAPMRESADYLTLLSILQYLIDNPECKKSEVKREVFRAISICNKLRSAVMVAVDTTQEVE